MFLGDFMIFFSSNNGQIWGQTPIMQPLLCTPIMPIWGQTPIMPLLWDPYYGADPYYEIKQE